MSMFGGGGGGGKLATSQAEANTIFGDRYHGGAGQQNTIVLAIGLAALVIIALFAFTGGKR